MFDTARGITWAFRLRNYDGQYLLSVDLGGWVEQVGELTAINHDQWYLVKIHHRSGTDGEMEWWLDDVSQGALTYDTSAAKSGVLNGVYLNGMDAGTTGKLYFDDFQVTQSDAGGADILVLTAENITLSDVGGNTSEPVSSPMATLSLVTEPVETAPVVVTTYTLSIATNMTGAATITPAVGAHTYESGSSVTISAQPLDGYEFVEWQGDVANPSSNSTTVLVNGDKTVTAVFAETPVAAEEALVTAYFTDDLESGNMEKWDSVSTGITASGEARVGQYGIVSDIQTTTRMTAVKNLGADYDETYVSFYFKMDPAFTMAPKDLIFVTVMFDTARGITWALRLRNTDGQYQLSVDLGGWVEQVGELTAINHDQWYLIKIHHRSGTAGEMEWWLDDVSRGALTYDTSAAKSGVLNGVYLNGMDEGTTGKLYFDEFMVTPSDYSEPAAVIPQLQVEAVTITPNSGYLTTGDTVTITVTATDNETGLTASPAVINGQSITLADQNDGTYTGIYTVAQNDPQGENIEATGIVLTNADGLSSDPASSSGSTLRVDTQAPSLVSVTLTPDSGDIKVGDEVLITVTAANNESGLTPSPAQMDGQSITLADQGDGTYTGAYTVPAQDSGDAETADAVFVDDFELGNTGRWNTVIGDLVVDNNARTGNYGVEYDMQTTNLTRLVKELDSDYTETYTSYYFKMDSDFVMVPNDVIYLSLMSDSAGKIAWALRLRMNDDNYEISCYLGGWKSQVGTWSAVNHDQWHAVKIHYQSDVNGTLEWWLDNTSQAVFTGNTSVAKTGKLNGIYLNSMDEGTTGKLYFDDFRVTQSDTGGTNTMTLAAENITLTDAGGNTSSSASSEQSVYNVIQSAFAAKVAKSAPQRQSARISDLSVESVSENYAVLNWTVPSSGNTSLSNYVIEISKETPVDNTLVSSVSFDPGISPKSAAATEQLRLSGLESGAPYFIAVKTVDSNRNISAISNIVELTTLVAFVDDDLDADDPYIVRDSDSLYVSDNDNLLNFSWSSFESKGAMQYEVKVYTGNNNELKDTSTVTDTYFTIMIAQEGYYSIEVTPLLNDGSRLTPMRSRVIYSNPVYLEPPGTPMMTSQKNNNE